MRNYCQIHFTLNTITFTQEESHLLAKPDQDLHQVCRELALLFSEKTLVTSTYFFKLQRGPVLIKLALIFD